MSVCVCVCVCHSYTLWPSHKCVSRITMQCVLVHFQEISSFFSGREVQSAVRPTKNQLVFGHTVLAFTVWTHSVSLHCLDIQSLSLPLSLSLV